MQELSEHHRRWVANYFGGKVEELYYHLVSIVDACDQEFHLFENRQEASSKNAKTVIFGFSSFSNVVLTLKDATKTVAGEPLSRSRIKQLRHGAFILDARNAATHDGHPIVTAWVDGRYFVPAKISRLGMKKEIIDIPAPNEDIRTICLEFSEDFCQLLRSALLSMEDVGKLAGALFSMSDLEESVVESLVIPEFAKKLFRDNRKDIEVGLRNVSQDPVAQAIGHLNEVVRYCELSRE